MIRELQKCKEVVYIWYSLFGQLLPFSFIFDVNELIFFPTFLIDEIVAYDPMS